VSVVEGRECTVSFRDVSLVYGAARFSFEI
jgi:hypothetical protein